MTVTFNLAVLLAVVIYLRIRRTVHARSRSDQWLTVVIVLVFGLLVAPTDFGQGVLNVVGQLAQGISQTE
ncbi:hypothetical protein DY218_07310 [Streptomyces triticagri]|uniref:Uncharacterized protein n=1 Tax=Streptomyces triticagri TaxID=2293568 RepID=A0A372M8R1_9ACTN|nr:hypothetical protein [Streptomyces triticagri]RFU87334.1 hypothetical protein DY218_07310 [Streptomyces triticagri]